MKKINVPLLNKMLADGMVVSQKHPTLDICLYNYTRKCTYEKVWNEVTLLCRGLVLDLNYNIVSLPLGKFFNFEEFGPERIEAELRGKKYHVYDKKDGSCGILVEYKGNYLITTRGSFSSEQAIWATELLNNKYLEDVKKLDTDNFTYVFEIVYPTNRIVVSYGDFADIVFLARINKNTGVDEMLEDNIKDLMKPFEVVERFKEYEGLDFEELKALNLANREGFVLHGNGMRIKVKFPDYCRLHSIITNITFRDIWDTLRQNKPLDEILENVPDEFDSWVKEKVEFLNTEFAKTKAEIIRRHAEVVAAIPAGYTKKWFAMKNLTLNKNHFFKGGVFAIEEGKDISASIWDSLYPPHEKPFSSKFNAEDDL
jgi:RNA ligase